MYHDGTTHEGEAFAIVLRWMGQSGFVHTRCICLHIIKSTMDAAGTAGEPWSFRILS